MSDVSASPPSAVLTQANPAKEFRGQPGTRRPIATSGVTGGATIKLQYRVRPTDAWVDDPNTEFVPDEHLSGHILINAEFNQIIVDGATGNTDVAVRI